MLPSGEEEVKSFAKVSFSNIEESKWVSTVPFGFNRSFLEIKSGWNHIYGWSNIGYVQNPF